MYYLTKINDVYKAVFHLFQRFHLLIYASQFKTSQIVPLLFVLLNVESVERKKLQKFEYLESEKSFIIFEGLSFGEKIKNSGHKL